MDIGWEKAGRLRVSRGSRERTPESVQDVDVVPCGVETAVETLGSPEGEATTAFGSGDSARGFFCFASPGLALGILSVTSVNDIRGRADPDSSRTVVLQTNFSFPDKPLFPPTLAVSVMDSLASLAESLTLFSKSKLSEASS